MLYVNNFYNTETIGISTEIAIADAFGVEINELYRKRGADDIISLLVPRIREIFLENSIPTVVSHIAEGGNPVDFLLETNKTLSVKTSRGNFCLVAPQIIGQATSNSYFEHISHIYSGEVPENYQDRVHLFKKITFSHISEMMVLYLEHLFDCDYLIYFGNVLCRNRPNSNFKVSVYPRIVNCQFDPEKFTFTQSLSSWNEGNTVKYDGVSLGQFQVHHNRDTFKFRFSMKGLNSLMERGLI